MEAESGASGPNARELEAADRRGAVPGGAAFLGVVLAVGALARLVLAAGRPLWADEVFTLTLARRPLLDGLSSLRLDSGPPLHYLLCHVLLIPFPSPGPWDALVRLSSVGASLLHVPLFLAVGRWSFAPRAGRIAAALFLLSPLAALYGAEGRGYALSSLLVLASFERGLAVRAEPSSGKAVTLGLVAGAAVLTHYLSVFPLASFATLLLGAGKSARRHLLSAAAIASLVVAPWVPIALEQPRGSMDWSFGQPLPGRATQVLSNLGLGIPADSPSSTWLAGVAGLVLVAAFVTRRATARIPVGVPLAAGACALAVALPFAPAILLPERTALPFLPLVCLAVAEAIPVLAWVPVAAGAAAFALGVPAWLAPTPAQQLAAALLPAVREGQRVCAEGLWGPELDYRFQRAGVRGHVVLFPSDVTLHPGWYEERGILDERLRAEAGALLSSPDPPRFFVTTPGARASAALLESLVARGARRVAVTPVFEVHRLPPVPAPERRGEGR